MSLFSVNPVFMSGVCFRCTSSFSHPFIMPVSSYFFPPKSSLCFLRQGFIFGSQKKSLRSSGVFPPITVSWMETNEKTFPLAASALGIVRKFNYGDSSRAKFNIICITPTLIPLGIVTLLLSDAPNCIVFDCFPGSADQPASLSAATASFDRDELPLKRLARTLR